MKRDKIIEDARLTLEMIKLESRKGKIDGNLIRSLANKANSSIWEYVNYDKIKALNEEFEKAQRLKVEPLEPDFK